MVNGNSIEGRRKGVEMKEGMCVQVVGLKKAATY